mmetsp:Transcript_45441/g.119367  ORF Transcript_45441/g.119367 Transcript_45441/m.119367 type:complete len:82 (+) Transcript_45441:232-477(+)
MPFSSSCQPQRTMHHLCTINHGSGTPLPCQGCSDAPAARSSSRKLGGSPPPCDPPLAEEDVQCRSMADSYTAKMGESSPPM